MRILPIILSGGFGTRLWPLSRQAAPKQFLNDLFGKTNLFNQALNLISNPELFLPSIAITHQDHKFLAWQEYKNLNLIPSLIILEPYSKNTAIAILAAGIKATEIYKNEQITLLILPSDHLISPVNLFEKSVKNAAEIVADKIVTFGVEPNFPSTGYGYIKKSQPISSHCFAIEKFIEKPDQQKAISLITEGGYLWNAGIFLMQADMLIKEAEKYLPGQVQIARNAIAGAKEDGIFCQINPRDYEKAQDISVDYAILEKSSHIATTSLMAEWNDFGDFNAIYEAGIKDSNNNVTCGDVELYNTTDSLIHTHNNLIACVNLHNMIVMETADAILIADKSKSQDIKLVVKNLLAKDKNEIKIHNRVPRPWGYYEIISKDAKSKVKKIVVNPNCSLSLQLHNHRSEHWIVVSGTATVQKDQEIFDLKPGQSTFIPIKTLHRLSNNGSDILEIIEVQMGNYIEEDDIVRLEDDYGR